MIRHPPRTKPVKTKTLSVMTLTIPKRKLPFSLITTETKSFGPVPASERITMVIPNARITQPRVNTRTFTGKPAVSIASPFNVHAKNSMIGHPHNMQITVPDFI